MTTPFPHPTPGPRLPADPPADILMRALQALLPNAVVELLLDRIEAAR